jgi:hypothetical protein
MRPNNNRKTKLVLPTPERKNPRPKRFIFLNVVIVLETPPLPLLAMLSITLGFY